MAVLGSQATKRLHAIDYVSQLSSKNMHREPWPIIWVLTSCTAMASLGLGFAESGLRFQYLQLQDIEVYDVFCGWAGIFLAARPVLSMGLTGRNAYLTNNTCTIA